MRAWAILILLCSIGTIPFSNSMYMYSIENDRLIVERYCLYHYIKSSSAQYSNSTKESYIFSIQDRDRNLIIHSHVLLRTTLLTDDDDDDDINAIIKNNLKENLQHLTEIYSTSLANNSSHINLRQKIPLPLLSALTQQNSILLVWLLFPMVVASFKEVIFLEYGAYTQIFWE